MAGVALIGLLFLSLILAGGAAGEQLGNNQTITLNDPGNETVEVDFNFSADTNATAELMADGNVLVDQTVQGTTNNVSTASLSASGIETGDKTLRFSVPTGETGNVSIEDVVMVYELTDYVEIPAGNGTTDVTFDVSFDSSEMAYAEVGLLDETAALVNASNLSFDPVEHSGGTGTNSTTFSVVQDPDSSVNMTAEVEVDPATAYEEAYVSKDSSFFGSFAGIESDTRLLMIGAGLFVLFLYGRSRDMV
jgi:hypothetical protein